MASNPPEESKPPTVKADYSSPNASKTFEYSLPATDTTTTEGKTAYLSELQVSVAKLQGDLNAFLTEKMEEDKVLASTAGQKVDDKKEEENYGEERVEDEG